MADNKKVQITRFGLYEPASDTRKIWIKWNWAFSGVIGSQDEIDYFFVKWYYQTPDEKWHTENDPSLQDHVKYPGTESTYTPPNNTAIAVKVFVTPISKKDKNGNAYFTGSSYASETRYWYYDNNPPAVPKAPTVEVVTPSTKQSNENTNTKPQLKMHLDLVDGDTEGIEFQVWKKTEENDWDCVIDGLKAVKTSVNDVTCTCTIEYGETYKVRCRAYKPKGSSTGGAYQYSVDYSDYTAEQYAPSKSPELKSVTVTSKNSVEIVWLTVKSAQNYYIEYVAKDPRYNVPMEKYFDIIGIQKQTEAINVKTDNIDNDQPTVTRPIVNLSEGSEYYIRVGSSSSVSSSSSVKTQWSKPVSFILGTQPERPTIWASNKTVSVGDPLNLYWMHNAKDNSVQTEAIMDFAYGEYGYDDQGRPEFIPTEIESYVYPGTYENMIIKQSYKSKPDDIADQTYIWEVNTSHEKIINGAALKWRMRTAGVLDEYSDWSEYNVVNIYEKPSFLSNIKDVNGNIIQSAGELKTFPLTVEMITSDHINQSPTGYYITITANSKEGYEIVNDLGEVEYISAGSVVYSKYIDTNENYWIEEISANHVTLANNVEYTVNCSVYMSSGLTATMSNTFVTSFVEGAVVPFATIIIDKDNLSASIRPYVRSDEEGVLLSVYRKEYDGTFTEIESDVENGSWIIDPHPALDYARYRIIAKSSVNGSVEYIDVTPIPVGEKSLVLQWAESWDYFYVSEDEEMPEYSRVGSMLKLPYNISVSHSNNPDVSLAKYIGRKNPVSYYGTQTGEKEGWSAVIEKTDKETLYALRRLSIWMGDVYVREPSGTGYWANVKVNYSTNPRELTVPISIDVVRVEGGK